MKKTKAKERSPDKSVSRSDDRDIRPHYDFSGGVRGKYAGRFAEGTNVIVLAPDLAAAFPDSEAVSRALRAYLRTKAKSRPT